MTPFQTKGNFIFFQNLIFVFSVFFSTLPFSFTSNVSNNLDNLSWVKFCRGQHKKVIHTQKCTKGIEFHRDLNLSCVCAKGAWVLFSDEGCHPGNSFEIVFGVGNCFRIQRKITRFVSLASLDTGSSFLIGNGIKSKHISETTQTSKVLELLNSNSKIDPSEFFQSLVCEKQIAKVREQNKVPSLLIFKFSNATVISSSFNSLVCNPKFREADVLKLRSGNVYFNNKHIASPLPKCSLQCKSHAPHDKNEKHAIAKRAIEKGLAHAPPTQPQDSTNEGLVQAKQNDATAALLRQNNAFLLFGTQAHLNVSKHWILLQKANKILKQACPMDRSIQDSMVRMFRYLFARFGDGRHEPREYLESESRLTKIIELLERCSAEAKKIEFKVGPPEACEKDKKVVEATIINRTITVSNLSANEFGLGPDEAYSKNQHDVHIEAIWKMISFTHYFCSEYFFANLFEHSAMTQMLLGFLGEDVLYRWHNPEVANKGFYAIFNAKNSLQKYMEGIDICVGIAKKIAIYPVWIKRPGTPKSEKGKQRRKRAAKQLRLNKCLNSLGETGLELCQTSV